MQLVPYIRYMVLFVDILRVPFLYLIIYSISARNLLLPYLTFDSVSKADKPYDFLRWFCETLTTVCL